MHGWVSHKVHKQGVCSDNTQHMAIHSTCTAIRTKLM